jgi:hypothetical protein
LQAVAWVVQNNPNRYSSVQDKFMSVWANSSIFNTQTGQFMTAPWGTTWVGSTQWPTATPQTVQAVLPRYIGMKDWSKVGTGQCGEFVNDYIREATGINYNMFVDPIDTRLLKGNSDRPTVWSVVIIDRRNDPKASELANTYGHVGIVSQVNADGSFNYKDQNGKNKLAIWTANNVKVWSNMRFFDPTKWANTGAQNAQWGSNKVMDAFWMINFDKPTLQKQQQTTIQNLIDKWDEEWAKLKLINLTKEWLSSAEAKKTFEASRSMVSSLWQIQETLAKLKAKWVNTWLLTGKYEEIANKFGKTWDKEVARLGTTLRDQLDALRRSRSGAALTAFEEEFYNRLFPSEGKSYNLNEQVIKWLQDSRNMLVRADIESVYWQDYANYLLSATEWRIQKNVAPVQDLLNRQTQQALAKQWATTTPTNNVASTSLSARRSSKWK